VYAKTCFAVWSSFERDFPSRQDVTKRATFPKCETDAPLYATALLGRFSMMWRTTCISNLEAR